MSKIKLLLDVVQDVHALADSLQAVADFIQLGTGSPEETPAQPVDSTPSPPKHTAPQITIDQVSIIQSSSISILCSGTEQSALIRCSLIIWVQTTQRIPAQSPAKPCAPLSLVCTNRV